MDYSPSGDKIIIVHNDNTIKVWDSQKGKILCSIEPPENVNTVTFNKAETHILVACDENILAYCQLNEGLVINNFIDVFKYGNLIGTFFNPNGNFILVTDNGFFLINKKGRLLRKKELYIDCFDTQFTQSTNLKSLQLFSSYDLVVIDTKTLQCDFYEMDNGYPSISKKEGKVISKLYDDGVYVYTTYKRRLLQKLKNQDSELDTTYVIWEKSKVNYEGKMLAASTVNYIKFFDIDNGKLIDSFSFNQFYPKEFEFLPNSNNIILIGNTKGEYGLYSPTQKRFDKHSCNFSLDNFKFSPNGKEILLNKNNKLSIYNVYSEVNLELEASIQPLEMVALSPSFKNMITQNNLYTRLWQFDGLLTYKDLGLSELEFIKYSKDGKKFLTASSMGEIKIWNASTGDIIEEFKESTSPLLHVNFTDNTDYFYTISNDYFHLWNAGDSTFKSVEVAYNGDQMLDISVDRRFLAVDYPRGCWFNDTLFHCVAIYDLSGDSIWMKIKIKPAEKYPYLTEKKYKYPGSSVIVSFNDNELAIIDKNNFKKFDINSRKNIHNHEFRSYNAYGRKITVEGIKKITPDKKYLLFNEWNRIKLYDLFCDSLVEDLEIFKNAENIEIDTFCISNDNSKLFIVGHSEFGGKITELWDLNSDSLIYSRELCTCMNQIYGIDSTGLIISSNAEKTELVLSNLYEALKLVQFNKGEHLLYGQEGTYLGLKNAAAKLHYIDRSFNIITFDQMDVIYNRPDKVLIALGEAFGNPDTASIKSYYRAWQKRVKKLGVDTTSFQDRFSVPESDFKNREQIAYEQTQGELKLTISAKDAEYKLDRLNVWINDVPVFGQRGVNIRSRELNELDTTVTVQLSEGDNKIETSVLNVNGIESYRIPLYVKYTASNTEEEKLYFVGIGVDQYREQGHDLKYSVKDIRDLSRALKKKYGNRLIIDTLFNQQVKHEKVLSIKNKLANASVNDKIIVSFSGHGLLDKQYDYYLATHTIDFQNPSKEGLSYEDLEWLLDSIPARKKLLLLDACHSGEVDKEELTAMNSTKTDSTIKGAKLVYQYNPILGMKNSFELMQELFANVNRGTGATVISASGGTQYAFESDTLKNGVFTYSILELMQQKQSITVSELKEKVGNRVIELTKGLQKPTSRSENIEFDWRVW